MRGLTVFNDHVVYHHDPKGKQPPSEGLSLSKFADLALRWSKYRDYLLRTQRTTLRKSSDYDGYPFEDFYEIRYGAENHYTASDDTSISITFNDTRDDVYDYVAMASRDTTTAYKRGRRGKPEETRFKVCRAIITRKEGGADVWVQGELVRLKGILDDLDQSTQSLRTWAESGINMRVFCTTVLCRADHNSAIISGNQLLVHANKGLSLDDLKQKLRCKACGARCSDISAA